MAEDLVKQLQEQIGSDHARGCQGRQYSCDCGYDLRTEGLLELAAASLAAKDAEIERLRHTSVGDWASQRENDALTIEKYEWKVRAEQAERALAEAVEVMRPTAHGRIDFGVMTRARAFVAQHGSDSREGK